LSLLVLSVYLFRKGRKVLYTLIPMVFLVIMTSIAMIMSLGEFIKSRNWVLTILSILLLSFSFWIMLEAVVAIRKIRVKGAQPDELR
ncbi:MAG: carbon starvation protein A, partial [Planctomycetes bacterium]|nr:carbon starvation protein A [Planctomycetota bacterium]